MIPMLLKELKLIVKLIKEISIKNFILLNL